MIIFAQHVYEKRYDYAMDISDWYAPYKHTTYLWINMWLYQGHVILTWTLQACNTFMNEYMTMPGMCHIDVHLTSIQHNYEWIHNYVWDMSYWCAPYKHTTQLWMNTQLCQGDVMLTCTLQVCNTIMNEYITMLGMCHIDIDLTSMQHYYEEIYNYARDMSYWCAPYKHTTQLWMNIQLCQGDVILTWTLQAHNTIMNEYTTMPGRCHVDMHLASMQHNYEWIYNYAGDVSYWHRPYKHAALLWRNI
jgi:hypothetical protein